MRKARHKILDTIKPKMEEIYVFVLTLTSGEQQYPDEFCVLEK